MARDKTILPRLDAHKQKKKPEAASHVAKQKKRLAKGPVTRVRPEGDGKAKQSSTTDMVNMFSGAAIQGAGVNLPIVSEPQWRSRSADDDADPDQMDLPHLDTPQNSPGDSMSLEVAGQDLQLPVPKKTTKPLRSPLAGFQPTLLECLDETSEDIDQELMEQFIDGPDRIESIISLQRVLKIHSVGVVLEIIRTTQKRMGEARPIFHCSHCLEHWQRFGVLPKFCSREEKLVRGPPIELTSNAARYLQKVWQGRLARNSYRMAKAGKKSLWRTRLKQLTNKDVMDAAEAKELLALLTADELKLLVTQGAITELITEGNLTVDEIHELIKKGGLDSDDVKHLINADTVKQMIGHGNMSADQVKGFLVEGGLDSDAVKDIINPDTIKHLLDQGALTASEMKELILQADLQADDVDDLMNQVSEFELVNKGKLGVEQMKAFIAHDEIKELISEGALDAEELAELVNQVMTVQLLKQDEVTSEEIEQCAMQETVLACIEEELISIDDLKVIINQCMVKQMVNLELLDVDNVKDILESELPEEELQHAINHGQLEAKEIKQLIQNGLVNDIMERGIIKELCAIECINVDDIADMITEGTIAKVLNPKGTQDEQTMNLIYNGHLGTVELREITYKAIVKQLIKDEYVDYHEMKQLTQRGELSSAEVEILIGQGKFDDDQSDEIVKIIKKNYGSQLNRFINKKFKLKEKKARKEKLTTQRVRKYITQGAVKELLDGGQLKDNQLSAFMNKALARQIITQEGITEDEITEMAKDNEIQECIQEGLLDIQDVKQAVNQCTVKYMMHQGKLKFQEVKTLLNLDICEDDDVHAVINQGELEAEDIKTIIQVGMTNELTDRGIMKEMIANQQLEKDIVKTMIMSGAIPPVILPEADEEDNQDVTEAKALVYKGAIKELVKAGNIGVKEIKQMIVKGNLELEDIQVLVQESSLNDTDAEEIGKTLRNKLGLGIDELLKAKFKDAHKRKLVSREGKGVAESEEEEDSVWGDAKRRNTFLMPGHIGNDASYNMLLDDVVVDYEREGRMRRRNRALSRSHNIGLKEVGKITGDNNDVHHITSYRGGRRGTLLNRNDPRTDIGGTGTGPEGSGMESSSASLEMDTDTHPGDGPGTRRTRDKSNLKNPLAKNRTGKPDTKVAKLKGTQYNLDKSTLNAELDYAGSDYGSYAELSGTMTESQANQFSYSGRHSAAEGPEIESRPGKPSRRTSVRPGKQRRESSNKENGMAIRVTDPDENVTEEMSGGTRRKGANKKMKDGSVRRTAGRSYNSRQIEDVDSSYSFYDSQDGDRQMTPSSASLMAGSVPYMYMARESSSSSMRYYHGQMPGQSGRPPSGKCSNVYGSHPRSSYQSESKQSNYLPPLTKSTTTRGKTEIYSDDGVIRYDRPVAEVTAFQPNQAPGSPVPEPGVDGMVVGPRPTEQVRARFKPQMPARQPLILPDPDGISVLDFTPAFTFSLYTLPPGYRKQNAATATGRNKEKPASIPAKPLPNIQEKPARRNTSASDVSNLSKKIQQKLNTDIQLSKYMDDLDDDDWFNEDYEDDLPQIITESAATITSGSSGTITENQHDKLSASLRAMPGSRQLVSSGHSMVSNVQPSVTDQASGYSGQARMAPSQNTRKPSCHVKPTSHKACQTDSRYAPSHEAANFSLLDVDIHLQGNNTKSTQTVTSFIKVIGTSSMSIQITDSVVIQVKDYVS